jgi:hypothetical protein
MWQQVFSNLKFLLAKSLNLAKEKQPEHITKFPKHTHTHKFSSNFEIPFGLINKFS